MVGNTLQYVLGTLLMMLAWILEDIHQGAIELSPEYQRYVATTFRLRVSS